MDFSLDDYHRTNRLIDSYTENYSDILMSFYDRKTSSFYRKNTKEINNKRKDLWELYNSKEDSYDKNLLEKYLGKGLNKNDFYKNIINLTSSTSCYLSLFSKYYDIQYFPKCFKFDKEKLKQIIFKSPWTSTGLKDYNFYTTCLLLPALKQLGGEYKDKRINIGIDKIKNELILTTGEIKKRTKKEEPCGCIALEKYPPNAFLTYWALKSLKSFDQLNEKNLIITKNWAFENLTKQIFYHNCENKELFDVYQLSYCFLILKEFFSDYFKNNFSESMMHHCLEVIFTHQEEKGNWRVDKPLFHYPGAGNAYCHDFEMLVCLLNNFKDDEYNLLKPFNDNFKKSLKWIKDHYQKGETKGQTKGWSSYHHHNWKKPESWATSAVLNFLHLYNIILTRQTEDDIFEYFNYDKNILRKCIGIDQMMGSSFMFRRHRRYLKKIINNIITKIKKEGGICGLILYGPPGSSKTTYAKAIAKELQWRYVEINPGQFIEKGISNIEQTTKSIFDKLYILNNVVILFDEFDELVRERVQDDKSGQSETISRFITTSMLPKIQRLRDGNKNQIFIVATNHLEKFDSAIQRRGRFDYIIPVTYPCYEEKMTDLKKELKKKGISRHKIKKLEEKYVEITKDLDPKIEIKVKIDGIEENINIEKGSIKDLLERLSYSDYRSIIDEIFNLLNENNIEDKLDNFINDNYAFNDVRAKTEWEVCRDMRYVASYGFMIRISSNLRLLTN